MMRVLVTSVRKLTYVWTSATRAQDQANRRTMSHIRGKRVLWQMALSQAPVRAMADGHQKPAVVVDKQELKAKLTAEQYHVTQEQGTEAPWTGMSVSCLPITVFSLPVHDRRVPDSEREWNVRLCRLWHGPILL